MTYDIRSFVAGAITAATVGATVAKYCLTESQVEKIKTSAKKLGTIGATTFTVPHELLDISGRKDRTLRKAETILRRRTSRLIVVVERSNQSHNYTAIIRTAEALGIQHIWVIAPPAMDGSSGSGGQRSKRKEKNQWKDDQKELEDHCAYARGALRWVDVRAFGTTAECLAALKADNRKVWVTDLSQKAECLSSSRCSSDEFPEKLAICFGSESTGASAELLAGADKRVYLPLHGFADSLNLSVAAALCVHQLFHMCPEIIGSMSENERHQLRKLWYPKMARTPEDLERYSQMAQENKPILPLGDLRRADEHRNGWLKKSFQKKNADLGFVTGIGH